MSKILSIPNGDYIINVKEGTGKIYLGGAEVTVKGDLIVEGETTTVNTTNLEIEDRVILINKNEQGPGITGLPGLQKSGLEIERGANAGNAFLVFDEELDVGNTTIGAFSIYTSTGVSKTLAGLQTNLLFTSGEDLEVATGAGVISVTSLDYTSNVTGDNDIPNFKAVQDYVALYANANPPTETVSGDSKFQARDSGVVQGVTESELNFIVDNVRVGAVLPNRSFFQNMELSNQTITSTGGNADLNLKTSGSGQVIIDSPLLIKEPANVPGTNILGTVLYNSPSGTDSKIFFKTPAGKNGELTSKKTAVLFSLIF